MSSRVPITLLRDLIAPGRPLPFRVLDNLGRLLLAPGQCIHDAHQLAALLERGACVDEEAVESARKVHVAAQAAATLAKSHTPYAYKKTWFDSFEQQTWALDGLLRQLGKADTLAAQIEVFATEYTALVQSQLDAAIFMCVRQQDNRFALYALTHALHTATVVVLTTRHLGWAADRERIAVQVALTMNGAMVELQARMAEQREPPTRKQLELIRAHPQQGVDLLRSAGVTDEDWLAAVQDHHERADGTGYPRGVTDVGDIARVVRAADVYTAKISPRALRAPMLPQQAAAQLFKEERGGRMAAALIKALGVYPPGDFVQLKNGDTAVVVQRATAHSAAQVVSLRSAVGKPVPGAPRRDTANASFAITGSVTDRSTVPRVLPEQIYGVLEA